MKGLRLEPTQCPAFLDILGPSVMEGDEPNVWILQGQVLVLVAQGSRETARLRLYGLQARHALPVSILTDGDWWELRHRSSWLSYQEVVDPTKTDLASALARVRRPQALVLEVIRASRARLAQLGSREQVLRELACGLANREGDLDLLGPSLLGRVYEDLLGWTVESGRLVPATDRRRQGSYYTPPELVRVLSELALAPLLEGLSSREELLGLRLLDPAMGAGGVLLGLLDALVRAWTRLSPGTTPTPLTTLRARLVQCLVGMDLDPGALLVARLTLGLYSGLPAEELPGLSLGDALQDDALPTGFDAVVGNPPYHRELEGRELFQAVRRSALGRHARSKGDLWFFFTHLALELLRPGGQHVFLVPSYWLKATGAGPRHLREELAAKAHWRALVGLEHVAVFRRPCGGQVGGRHVLFAVERWDERSTPPPVEVYRAERDVALEQVALAVRARTGRPGVRRVVTPAECVYGDSGKVLLDLALTVEQRGLLERIRGGRLPEGWRLSEGITANPEHLTARAMARVLRETGVDLAERGLSPRSPVFLVDHDWTTRVELTHQEREHLVPFLPHVGIERLRARPGDDAAWLIYTTRNNAPSAEGIPNLAAHLAPYREVMELRRETRRGRRAWFHLHWPRRPELLVGERVLIPRMTRWPSASSIQERCATGESVYTLVPEDPAWSSLAVALLNALPFSLGILLTTKARGKGVDIPRAAIAQCPWPQARVFAAAASLRIETLELPDQADPPTLLAVAGEAARRLSSSSCARSHEGPWWEHPDPAVARLGRVLDESVCRLVGVDYDQVRRLAAPAPPEVKPLPRATRVEGEGLLVSWEPAWSEAGLGAPAVHVQLHGPRKRLDAIVDPSSCREVPGVPGLVRLDPTIELETFEVLALAAGCSVAPVVAGQVLWVS